MATMLDVVNRGDLRGYEMGAPSLQTAEQDSEVCDGCHCSVCGHMGLRYVPYVQHQGCSYKAYAVCPSCGEAHEF